jgi:hypothetical protein
MSLLSVNTGISGHVRSANNVTLAPPTYRLYTCHLPKGPRVQQANDTWPILFMTRVIAWLVHLSNHLWVNKFAIGPRVSSALVHVSFWRGHVTVFGCPTCHPVIGSHSFFPFDHVSVSGLDTCHSGVDTCPPFGLSTCHRAIGSGYLSLLGHVLSPDWSTWLLFCSRVPFVWSTCQSTIVTYPFLNWPRVFSRLVHVSLCHGHVFVSYWSTRHVEHGHVTTLMF